MKKINNDIVFKLLEKRTRLIKESQELINGRLPHELSPNENKTIDSNIKRLVEIHTTLESMGYNPNILNDMGL